LIETVRKCDHRKIIYSKLNDVIICPMKVVKNAFLMIMDL